MIEIKLTKNKSDFKIIADLATDIWTEHYTPIIGIEQVEYMLKKFQSPISIENQVDEGYQYYLVSANEIPVGYLSFIKKESALFLSKIYVLNSARGKGIGKLMLDFIQEKAVDLKLESIALTVNRNNSDSISAYEKMGFQNKETQVSDIGNGFVMDDFLMEKKLN